METAAAPAPAPAGRSFPSAPVRTPTASFLAQKNRLLIFSIKVSSVNSVPFLRS